MEAVLVIELDKDVMQDDRKDANRYTNSFLTRAARMTAFSIRHIWVQILLWYHIAIIIIYINNSKIQVYFINKFYVSENDITTMRYEGQQ